MDRFRNFKIASYAHANFLSEADANDIQKGIDYFNRYVPLDKVYLEVHRGPFDIPREKLRQFKDKFQENGIKVAGGITSTLSVEGMKKNSIFDVLCYSEPAYRKRYLEIVKYAAEEFDEIILDDFFFTACRCERCIEKKGARSWEEYRTALMEEVAREVTEQAAAVNPKCRVIIKYPNWYDSYQETGYCPDRQKDIFAGIFTGTETRNTVYDQQHLPRYLSYSLPRYLERTAPGRNGGGWIDLGFSSGNLNYWVDQACFTLLSGARELMLFNFSELTGSPALPPLAPVLERMDNFLDQAGVPEGLFAYEPLRSVGEDFIMQYMGMLGIPFEPVPEWEADGRTESIFLDERAACDPDVVEKLKKHLLLGKKALITTGFLRATYDRGMKDLTSIRFTNRRVSGREYWIDSYTLNRKSHHTGDEPVSLEVLEYRTNATWCEAAMVAGECNFPLLLSDCYGDGCMYTLNVPDNFSDLYFLPPEVTGYIAKSAAPELPLYMESKAKHSMFLYDNNVFGVVSLRPYPEDVKLVTKGEGVRALQDIDTGEIIEPSAIKPGPVRRFDVVEAAKEPVRKVFDVPVENGAYRFFKILME
ncbi:hypothetical protein [Murimonas intestini]|uniref:hypothetical protein n=1 Tax=Murimonas intestini TaxID=1337051 RepID=UPI0011DDCCD8|nr:hypothetical protein [Murimonas intestini]